MPSSDSEDDLVAYGTPLEPLDEDEIPNKKPRLLEDQVVKDKQGRRRFHGAFTGGFSAGFFNTVGSLEGWTPSSFKSSKSNKQEIFQQKPEDFMDEEDVSEFGIAPVVLKARQDYAVESKTRTPVFPEILTLGNYILQDVLRPVRETIGVKLLKKMGWKPGQGVGPRLNKNEKKIFLKMRQKSYGCELPPGSLDETDSDSDLDSESEWSDLQFAPSDYEPFFCETRNTFYGLGYEGLDKRPVLSGTPYVKGENSSKKKNKIIGSNSQAFGVGAFEEEDEDIYAKDDMSRYNFFLGKDDSAEENRFAEKNIFTPDGVLEGFSVESKTRPKKHYPLPAMPRDLKPHHRVRHSRFDQHSPSNRKILRGSEGNDKDRRKLFDKPSEETREAKTREEILVKELIASVKINESKFKPFSSNPEKQGRYENYLKLVKIGKKEFLNHLQPLTMTNWDKEREKIEFEKAALLFRPLSGGMEDRFSTASQPDDLSDPLAVVQKYVDESDDRRKAAKMKMFGPVTRRTEDWAPNALLCKRFNIPQPENNHSQGRVKGTEKREKSYFNLFDSVQNLKEDTEKIEVHDTSHEKLDSEETLETLQGKEQNITDLYKAIFLASDDEEKNSEEVSEREKTSELENSRKTWEEKGSVEDDVLYEDKLINSKRNLSPPKGIFKNIDLESLSGREKREASMTERSHKDDPKGSAETSTPPLNVVYGPQIPEKIAVKTVYFTSAVLQDAGVWVEKKNRSEKKHKKKDKKKKKSSHKSKHKHKHKTLSPKKSCYAL